MHARVYNVYATIGEYKEIKMYSESYLGRILDIRVFDVDFAQCLITL